MPSASVLLATHAQSNVGGDMPLSVGCIIIAVAIGGFIVFELFKSRFKPLQRLLNAAAPMTKEAKAAFAVRGIHIALSMLLCVGLIAFGFMGMSLVYTLIFYMLFGWIPLWIWLYPILVRRMK